MAKLCARGKAAAKRKFKVYPSAYANAYGVKVCKGQVNLAVIERLLKDILEERDEFKKMV